MPYESHFAALAHPLRQQILDRLTQAPASVRELTDVLEASQPVVSQHLKVLRDTGLVTVTPEGAKSIHQVNAKELNLLRAHLEQHWQMSLDRLEDMLDDDPPT